MPLAEELDLKAYGGFILSYNGGRIMNCTTGEVVFSRELPVESNRTIIGLAAVSYTHLKSTFLRCLNLLETPTSGRIYFEGTDITDKSVDINLHRQKMGMVFQHFNVFNNLTVGKNVTLAPVLLGKKSQKEAEMCIRDSL